MWPSSSTATSAPATATTTRSAHRPATRAGRRQGAGSVAVGSLTSSTLLSEWPNSGGDGVLNRVDRIVWPEDPAQRDEPHRADERGDRDDQGDLHRRRRV